MHRPGAQHPFRVTAAARPASALGEPRQPLGAGSGSAGHVALTRPGCDGSAPVARYLLRYPSTHLFGGTCNDWPWMPLPGTTTILAVGSNRCAFWAPAYGVAGSSVPCSMRMPGSPCAPIRIGRAGPCTGQNAHAALNQALSQDSNGAD